MTWPSSDPWATSSKPAPYSPTDATTRERQLGTVIKLINRRDQHKAVQTLLAAGEFDLLLQNTDWGVSYYELFLTIDVDLLDHYSDNEVFEQVKNAYDSVWAGRNDELSNIVLRPGLSPANWRADVAAFLGSHPTNQATLVSLPDRHPIVDGMHFRDRAEKQLYDALVEKQASLPEGETLTIIPNCAARVLKRTWEPDFVIVHRGKAGVIEVDGTSHLKKWANDRSRDEILENCGFVYVGRIDARDADNPAQARAYVDRFLSRLTR